MRKPFVYCYTRVSTLDQVDGHSLGDQSTRFLEKYARSLSEKYDLGCIIKDEGVSASKVPLFKRREGRKLRLVGDHVEGIIQPGDMIYFDKMSRGFRSVRDWSNCLDYFREAGVELSFGDIEGSGEGGGTAVSKLIMNILSTVCQFESDLKSEYALERNASAKYLGAPASGGKAPLGWKKVKRDGGTYLELCYLTRRLMQQIVKWRDEGRTYYWIQTQAECLWARIHGIDPPVGGHEDHRTAFYPWHFTNRSKIIKWEAAGRALMDKGELDKLP